MASLTVQSTGLSTMGMLVLSKEDKNIAGRADGIKYFGQSIAACDITGDGIADVLVGVPSDNVGKAKEAGSVVLLRGSHKGLTGNGSQTITQSSAGIPGSPERLDNFGASVSLLREQGVDGRGQRQRALARRRREIARMALAHQ